MLQALEPLLPDVDDDAAQVRWARVRRPEREGDRALTGTTRHWFRRLPPRRRPSRLCMLFPRVANRIAWCWHDVALSAQVLEDLLVDRRGGRRGFPPAVVRELQRLREFNDQQRVEMQPETLWETVSRLAAG
jgi:hypothetical protein